MQNNQSIYDVSTAYDTVKQEADIIYNVFINRDTTTLDEMLQKIDDINQEKFTNLSNRYKQVVGRTIHDKDVRVAKHAMLMFGLYMTPEYAITLVKPTPKVNPIKFEVFYRVELPNLCEKLLNGHFTSLQEFVESARTTYIIL